MEDVTRFIIALTILLSAAVAWCRSVDRLLHPQPIQYLWTVVLASIIGFAGDELVAVFRIRVILFGAIGIWLGYPLADLIAGLLITIAILGIVWESGKQGSSYLLGGRNRS